MKLFKHILIVTTAITTTLSSCRSDLLDTAPYDSVSSETMWANENLCEEGVAGVYAALSKKKWEDDDFVAGKPELFERMSVSATWRDNNEIFLNNTASRSSGMFSDYWKQHYEGIQRANDAISNLEKAPISESVKKRLIAESKFLRAYFYYKLNMVFKGVPLYLEPADIDHADKPRESEAKIWEAIIADLTDCINETNLPDRYKKGDSQYGHVGKSAAYALRGKVYMWTKEWAKAESDFLKVGELGHTLFQEGYQKLFKEANEQCDEMIFSLQRIDLQGYGNAVSFRYGSRSTFGSCWNSYMPNTDFVESYELQDGSKFKWTDYIPEYNDEPMTKVPALREILFIRDTTESKLRQLLTDCGILKLEGTPAEKEEKMTSELRKIGNTVKERLKALGKLAKKELKLDSAQFIAHYYQGKGNEERIIKAFEKRDPRLSATIITPYYGDYLGSASAKDYKFVIRWPYYGADLSETLDLRTDTKGELHYLFRKFVAEGTNEMSARDKSPIDIPLIRYADVILNLAEALNEQGKTKEAIEWVNKVRRRAGARELNTNEPTTVNGQDDLRIRIQNERRWELAGEGITYFDEIRWKTWKEAKFNGDKGNAGNKNVWGALIYAAHIWPGDHAYVWPIPQKEIEMNPNLTQNPGW